MSAVSEGVDGLADAVARMPGPAFAVIDGAQVDNIVVELDRIGLRARPLFLPDDGDRALAGPWLAQLDGAPAYRRLQELVADKPSCVFWSCVAGDVALHDHLRRVNRVRMPEWAAARRPGPGDDDNGTLESVLFRHWDPRVLALVLPLLDAGQQGSILGPAEELAFLDPDSGRSRKAVRTANTPASATGTLTLRPRQILDLNAAMQERSRQRVALCLRQAATDQVRHLNDARLSAAVAQCMAEAFDFGVIGERGIGLWAFIRATSRGDLSQEPLVRRFLADPVQGLSPDDRMQALFDVRTDALRERV